MGTAVGNDGAVIASTQDIVYVNMNYRLGAFGFLSSPPDEKGELQAPGNVGLWDQIAALEWIRDHISNFGGNPKKVTIGGLSAGSMSVSILNLSPEIKSRNLFSSVIMMSGSSLSPGNQMPQDNAISMTIKIADKISCSSSKLSETFKCLRNVSLDSFINVSGISFLPIYGQNEILPQKSAYLLKDSNQDLSHLRILSGVTNLEGSLVKAVPILDVQKITKSNQSECIKELKNFLTGLGFEDSRANQIASFYVQESKVTQNVTFDREQMIYDFIGDLLFVCPARSEIEKLSDFGASVHQYVSMYQMAGKDCPGQTCHDQVGHGQDWIYFSGESLLVSSKSSESDQRQSSENVDTLGQFVRHEELIVQSSGGSSKKWPLYNSRSRMAIGMNFKNENPIIFDFRGNFCQQFADFFLS